MGTLTGDTPSLPEHCQHKLPTSCRLSATSKCCACQDLRIHKSAYAMYVDGVGMVERGTRWQRYCWFCKTFWDNRIRMCGIESRETRVPEHPDQSPFLEKWFDYHRGYKLSGRSDDGGRTMITVQNERPWKDVAPGFLPTLDQPDVPLPAPTSTSPLETPEAVDVSLEHTLDNLMNATEDDEDELQVTQLIQQDPTPAMQDRTSQVTLAPSPRPNAASERIAATRSRLSEAQSRRRELRLELAQTEQALAESQRNLAELTQAQHTVRNMERVFGTRDEVQSQGASYTSPLASMFSRAYDRYNTAEEVRAAARASDANHAGRLAMLADLLRSTEQFIEGGGRNPTAEAGEDAQPCSLDDERILRPPPKTEQQMQVSLTCRICLQQTADTAVLPCGHLIMCVYCSKVALPTRDDDQTKPQKRSASCPLCKARVKKIVRIYTS